MTAPETSEQKQIRELMAERNALLALQVPAIDGRVKQVHDYAWGWFQYHAQQRTNVFNFFMAAAALLFAGFASAVGSGNSNLAVVVALVGAVVSFSFLMIDRRNEELVNQGKKVLKVTERALFIAPSVGGNAVDLGGGIVNAESDDRCWKSIIKGRHRVYFRVIEVVVSVAFASGAVLAHNDVAWLMEPKPDGATALASAVAPVAISIGTLAASVERSSAAVASAMRRPAVAPPSESSTQPAGKAAPRSRTPTK